MIKAVIFDLDGTLLYTLPDLTAAMSYAMRCHGFPEITPEMTESYIGNGVRKYAERSAPPGTDAEVIDSCVAKFKEYYRDHTCVNTYPYKGITELIEKLKQKGIKLGVQSNKYHEATAYMIEHYFPNAFLSVYGECEKCPRKPDPSGTLLILDELGVRPGEALFVGDSSADIKVAKNAQCIPISVTWGYRSREALTLAGAENFVNTPEEIYNAVLRYNGEI